MNIKKIDFFLNFKTEFNSSKKNFQTEKKQTMRTFPIFSSCENNVENKEKAKMNIWEI